MAPLVHMTVLGVIPKLSEHVLCPFCGQIPLELVVAWSTPTEPVEVEVGAYCESPSCDTFFIDGPE